MPIPIFGEIYYNGVNSIPYLSTILKIVPWIILVVIVKIYFNGAKNGNERVMHGKVAIVTGGTSGIGQEIVHDLASRGAQIILLVRDTKDVFTVDYISDLRARHDNELIYAEECDLSSLHSIRLFATKFIDNSPPRRLDMVICCAGVMAPPSAARAMTKDGVEIHWGINYLAHFHLLNILSPVLRAQPSDRDVRIMLATCTSHVLGDLDLNDVQFLRRGYPSWRPWRVYGASKLALMAFCIEFQRRLTMYERPDKQPNNIRIFNVDPGLTRTPGMRRWLSLGSLSGLAAYLFSWPFWWLVLKDPSMGAQSFLAAAMSPECGIGEGGKFLRDCQNQIYRNELITSPELGKQLWTVSELMIKEVEKESALKRAKEKKKSKSKDKEAKAEPTEELDKELKDNIRKKLAAQAAKTKAKQAAMDMILEEEVKKDQGLGTGIAKEALKVAPDTPSRNTRSRTAEKMKEEEAPEEDGATEVTMPDTPSKNTRRRSRKV
ncbi:hypothetical protein RUND412_004963 [Rhizina undulata]